MGGFDQVSTDLCKTALTAYIRERNINISYLGISSCETQVVAGINFKMQLNTVDGECGITLYRNFSNQHDLNRNNSNTCEKYFVAAEDN